MRTLLTKLGPGLLYAGAAVGVSHLIQSTRAGANYGLIMIIVVIVANVLKYPFFKAAPIFTSIQKKSAIEAFHEMGKWPMLLFYAITILPMFIVQAVIALITASIMGNIFNIQAPLWLTASLILLFCGLILIFGKYQLLSKTMKYVILLLSGASIVTLLAAIFGTNQNINFTTEFSFLKENHLFFLIALVGWMPAPLDIGIWHSEWTLENQKLNPDINLRQNKLDFNIGYWGTTLLAIIFVALGSLLLNGKGVELPESGVAFAAVIIEMYTSVLGDWSYLFIAIAAFTTMLSTTLTVLDAYPRVLSNAIPLSLPRLKIGYSKLYIIVLMGLILGSFIVLKYQLENMKQLVDLATSISFLTAPILAILFLRMIKPIKNQVWNKTENFIAKIGLVFLFTFSFYYIWMKWF